MSLLQSNATVSIKRGSYNAATKQTSAPTTVSGLAAVPVYIEEIGRKLRERGQAPEFDLKMLWDSSYDVRDGDQVAGYNPGNAAVPSILTVQHAASSGVGTPVECRVAFLKALKPAGSST